MTSFNADETQKSLSPAELFDSVGAAYDEAFADRTEQNKSIDWLIKSIPSGGNVLDVGCGPGSVSARVGKAGLKIHGIDISTVMVGAAQKLVPAGTFERADFVEFNAEDGSYDGVVMQFSLIADISRKQLVDAWVKTFRILKKGGVFAYATVDVSGENMRTRFLGRSTTASAYNAEETARELRKVGFEVMDVHQILFQPKWTEGLGCSKEEVSAEPHVYICARKP